MPALQISQRRQQVTPGMASAGFNPGTGRSPSRIHGATPSGAALLWQSRQVLR
jgi:hypothetical protein